MNYKWQINSNNSEPIKMKFNLTPIGVIVIIAAMSACGPSQSELASQKIRISESLLAKGDTLNSLMNLDSIPKLFPQAGSELNKAVMISNRIRTSLLLNQRDKLAAAKAIIATLIKEFKPEKGEFEKYTIYIPNRQVFDKSWSRSFVQVYVNEKGDLSLASNYYGERWLNHTSLKIIGPLQTVKTDSVPIENILNRHSDFGGSVWEKVTYRGKQADLVIGMIASNWDKKLKAVFTDSGKNTYIMWLEDYDKKAIKDSYELSKALKVKFETEKRIRMLERKIKS